MSRAIGDISFKDQGLIATPEIVSREITDKDAFLVLATDGVFEVMGNQVFFFFFFFLKTIFNFFFFFFP